MLHIEWITPDDIVLNNGFENDMFSKDVKHLKKIRLIKAGNNYYLRYKIKEPRWVNFTFHKNNEIYFGFVQFVSEANSEQIERDYKTLHREEVLKNILK